MTSLLFVYHGFTAERPFDGPMPSESESSWLCVLSVLSCVAVVHCLSLSFRSVNDLINEDCFTVKLNPYFVSRILHKIPSL